MQTGLAITGACIVILSGIPYIVDTLKGKTHPKVLNATVRVTKE